MSASYLSKRDIEVQAIDVHGYDRLYVVLYQNGILL